MTHGSFSRKQALRNGWLAKPKVGGAAHVHWQVKDVAVALAHEVYELAMSNNQFRADFKELWGREGVATEKELIAKFVEINWPRLIPQARATLAEMLRGPYDDDMKEKIMEALSLDSTLIRGRQAPAAVLGKLS